MHYFDCYLVWLSSWLLLAWQPFGGEDITVCSFSCSEEVTLSGWSHQVEASKHCPRKMGWQFLASPNLICTSLKGQYFSGVHRNSYCKGCTQYARLCLLWWSKGFKRSIWYGRFFGIFGTPCLLHTSQSFKKIFSRLSFIRLTKNKLKPRQLLLQYYHGSFRS